MLHILHYRLQIPDDDSTPIENIITTLDEHFKAQTNEALRRRELFSCRQMIGERFNEFYVRVKTLAEAVEVCTGGHADCESTQLKQVILMGVSDQELVQKLIDVVPTHTLDQVVQHCYAYEAARRKASAITSPSTAARAVSSYMKGKKAKQRNSFSSSTTSQSPDTSSCDYCDHSHAKGQCKAADNIIVTAAGQDTASRLSGAPPSVLHVGDAANAATLTGIR